ncbi:MAG: polymorphic toxin-type HINT domain-containing protein [Patescibacteria group bacterium]|jgi:cysteine-rich repeat protein
MKKESKKFFLLGFNLTLSLGLIFLCLFLPQAEAANVNVNAHVVSPRCGDGIIQTALSEVCDDGNNSDCDGCKGDCTRPDKVCGDSIKECGEACESGSDCGEDTECNLCICGVPCFLAGTQISLAGGSSLAIEEIKVGDLVISYNEKTKTLEPSVVLKTFEHQASQYLVINQEIKVTSDHPLYVNNQWLKASQIKIGDKLLREDGQAIIVSAVEMQTGDVLVYNLEVDQNHNYFAQGYLAHNKGPPPCIPGPMICSYGPCVAGSQEVSCGNGCTTNKFNQDCYVPVCGNNIKDPGEECDDGNTVSGDGCSATCQLEVGCGDGSLDPVTEECDDNNITSGDCCSADCKNELLIDNISESVTNTTATIGWRTRCQSTSSLLEWGMTTDVNEGSASLSGQNYSHNITNLTPSTVYYYRITANAGSLQTVATGSFQTSGGVEICDNQIDDDSDGFCDYPASTCTDTSQPGDPECACEPDFLCTPGDCNPVTNKQTVACVDQTIPPCEADYDYEQDCGVCPGVTCGDCQELDEATCTCTNTVNCCGNDVCEPPAEDPYTCHVDCPVDCLSDWECTDWQPDPCPLNGIQTRECFDRNACPVPINPPALQQSCGPNCPGLSCGTCEQINIEQCVCQELIPCCGNGQCEQGETHEQCPQDCILPCTPNWTCLNWGACVAGIQRRECYDINNCNLNLDRPPETRSCTEGCEVACSTCQLIDLAACRCLATVPCCGNNICEEAETVWSCPVDCGLPPNFRFLLTQCLDGLDNDRDGLIDFPADPGCTKPTDNSELNFAEVIKNVQAFLQDKILDNPQVEQTNRIAAPILIATVAINTFATFSFFNFLSYLQFFITQPFAALFRRKRKKWGVVYNSLTKQPVDLAIVRLYQKENNRLIQSRVTDKLGRYLILAEPGRYYLSVTKPKFDFPTRYLKDKKEDVKFLDLYHGETIEVTNQKAEITANIPLDPQEDTKPVKKIIFQYYLRKVQYAAAFSAVPLATVSMIISPGFLTFTMFGFHCLLYVLFRRLGYQKPPKNWGIIYDQNNKKPLARAITRIYDKQYNKLLETRLTDARGRYSFLVNNNVYYVTAEKLGYEPHKTEAIDLIAKAKEAIVGLNIGLKKGGVTEALPSITPPVVTPPLPPVAPPSDKIGLPAKVIEAHPVVPPAVPPVEKPVTEPSLTEKVEDLEVGRKSLEELIKAKKEVKEVEEEITDKIEELEKLEEKVKDIGENIEEKLEKIEEIKPEAKVSKTQEKPEDKKSAAPPPEKSIFG